jgi:hypothetical protein
MWIQCIHLSCSDLVTICLSAVVTVVHIEHDEPGENSSNNFK